MKWRYSFGRPSSKRTARKASPSVLSMAVPRMKTTLTKCSATATSADFSSDTSALILLGSLRFSIRFRKYEEPRRIIGERIKRQARFFAHDTQSAGLKRRRSDRHLSIEACAPYCRVLSPNRSKSDHRGILRSEGRIDAPGSRSVPEIRAPHKDVFFRDALLRGRERSRGTEGWRVPHSREHETRAGRRIE